MISAVIPCYNAALWLRATIESVLAQSRPVSEVIVVDDGSTDASRLIAAEYPIRLLTNDVNRGVSHARNRGVQAATHDMVACLDADDFWDRHHCSVVVPLLERHPSAAVAFSAMRFVGARSGTWGRSMDCPGPSVVLWECFDATIVPGTTAVIRRQAYLEAGGFREDVRTAPDFDFWLRLALKHPFVWTREVTGNYRWHPHQISRNPLSQLRSVYNSRARLTRDTKDAGDAELAHSMRHRIRDILDEDLRKAWWLGDMARVRTLLALAHTHECETPLARHFRRRSWAPARLVKGWHAVQRLISAG